MTHIYIYIYTDTHTSLTSTPGLVWVFGLGGGLRVALGLSQLLGVSLALQVLLVLARRVEGHLARRALHRHGRHGNPLTSLTA